MSHSLLGQRIARAEARARRQFGLDVVVGERTYRMTTRSLKYGEQSYIPMGSLNAGAADVRVFEATPSDFPGGVAIGSKLTWQSNSYTVLLTMPADDIVSGVVVTLLLFAYRTPAPDSNTSGTEVGPKAGQRKKYYPAPSTL